MTWPTIFGNLAAGNQNLSLFDAMFAQIAQLVAVPCTASGANAMALTPTAVAPTVLAYTQLGSFNFLAAANSTAPVTIQFGTLAALPAYRADGSTQITSGDIVSGNFYTAVFSTVLNSGAGGFYLLRATIQPIASQVVASSFRTVQINNNGATPDTQIDVNARDVVMTNPNTGAAVFSANPVFTINALNVGVVNGLDTGTLAASNFYYVFAISNGVTVGGLISLSPDTPTLPAGYSFFRRLGTMRSDVTTGVTSTVTITQASPGVVTWTGSNFPFNMPVSFSTTGSLPAPLVAGTIYWVNSPTANTFQLAATPYAAPINTTSAGSGTHTGIIANPRMIRTNQRGRDVQYVITPLPSGSWELPIIASGVAGTYDLNNPTLVGATLANAVPTGVATAVKLTAINNWRGGAASQVLVAPNQAWGATGNGPNGGNGLIWPFWAPASAGAFNGGYLEMELEQSSIFWASSAAGGGVACLGWREGL